MSIIIVKVFTKFDVSMIYVVIVKKNTYKLQQIDSIGIANR